MNQDHLFEEHLKSAKLMYDQGKDKKYIETKLSEKSIDPQQLEEIMKQIKRLWHAKRSKNGAQLVLLGILLLGGGFISTIFLHFTGSNSLDFPLYGITATGCIILVIGLIFIFH